MAVDDYQQRVGQQLRKVRLRQGLTLQQVEERSMGRWKAVVVGAYERGHRAISAAKLAELAAFYGVLISELIPEPDIGGPRVTDEVEQPVTLDLAALAEAEDDETLEAVSRFVDAIQTQRSDHPRRLLTCRRADVRQLAAVLGVPGDRLVEKLHHRGLLAPIEAPPVETGEAGSQRRVLTARELDTERVLDVYILVDRGGEGLRPELLRLEAVTNALALADHLQGDPSHQRQPRRPHLAPGVTPEGEQQEG